MEEKEIIEKIKLLREIKPRKEWVLLVKREILGQPKFDLSLFSNIFRIFLYPRYQLALTPFLLLVILISGAFVFAQNSLPGDFLYPLKRISEKGQAIFVSEEKKPQVQLELANKRLEELTKIAKENQVQKLAPAINEFQESLSQAARDLKKPKKITKEIADQTKRLVENREKLEALGVVVGETEELDNSLKELVKREIQDLEKRTLTAEQEEILKEAKENFDSQNFAQALEKILEIGR